MKKAQSYSRCKLFLLRMLMTRSIVCRVLNRDLLHPRHFFTPIWHSMNLIAFIRLVHHVTIHRDAFEEVAVLQLAREFSLVLIPSQALPVLARHTKFTGNELICIVKHAKCNPM